MINGSRWLFLVRSWGYVRKCHRTRVFPLETLERGHHIGKRKLFGKWSTILSLRLVWMSRSCPLTCPISVTRRVDHPPQRVSRDTGGVVPR